MADAYERTRATLARGVLIFRWVWLAWLVMLAISSREVFVRPELAIATVGLTVGWTVWLTFTGRRWSAAILVFDLAVCCWLIVASGLVVGPGAVVESRPFFATGYPLSAALLWGATWGPGAGVGAGVALGFAQVMSRPINGVALSELTAPHAQNLLGAIVNYFVAGVAVGIVYRFLVRSAQAVEAANAALIEERERAARLAERESLARQIHDSVLQALAFVHKKGQELAGADSISNDDVAQLASVAGEQEVELRSLIARAPEEPPSGSASLREALERAARGIGGVDATVSSVGPVWLERAAVDEIAAAVGQALENVAEHAQARRVAVFAERDGDDVSVSVRDDGVGFVFDENALRADHKVGILKSIKGRIEDLGGTMTIHSEPGGGTEIELRLPSPTVVDR